MPPFLKGGKPKKNAKTGHPGRQMVWPALETSGLQTDTAIPPSQLTNSIWTVNGKSPGGDLWTYPCGRIREGGHGSGKKPLSRPPSRMRPHG